MITERQAGCIIAAKSLIAALHFPDVYCSTLCAPHADLATIILPPEYDTPHRQLQISVAGIVGEAHALAVDPFTLMEHGNALDGDAAEYNADKIEMGARVLSYMIGTVHFMLTVTNVSALETVYDLITCQYRAQDYHPRCLDPVRMMLN